MPSIEAAKLLGERMRPVQEGGAALACCRHRDVAEPAAALVQGDGHVHAPVDVDAYPDPQGLAGLRVVGGSSGLFYDGARQRRTPRGPLEQGCGCKSTNTRTMRILRDRARSQRVVTRGAKALTSQGRSRSIKVVALYQFLRRLCPRVPVCNQSVAKMIGLPACSDLVAVSLRTWRLASGGGR